MDNAPTQKIEITERNAPRYVVTVRGKTLGAFHTRAGAELYMERMREEMRIEVLGADR